DGDDGADADMEALKAHLDNAVAKAVAALPKPKDGDDGADADMEALKAHLDNAVAKAVAAAPRPAEVERALIDQDGRLHLIRSDGATLMAGVVVGPPGFSLEDFDVEQLADARVLRFQFAREGLLKTKEFRFPIVLDAGVYDPAKTYAQGDAVSWGGQLWIARRDAGAGEQPENGDAWRLAVLRGRSGVSPKIDHDAIERRIDAAVDKVIAARFAAIERRLGAGA
ncbi:MAG: hypothetical protein K2Q06_06125, partial [Parvularculaceae bacterium]|nr:hypothetical protein [Parvularculaceae bacterium]